MIVCHVFLLNCCSDVSDLIPQRETPQRAARKVKKYNEDEAFNELEDEAVDDPDFNFSDSDDDPDFDPLNKNVNFASYMSSFYILIMFILEWI